VLRRAAAHPGCGAVAIRSIWLLEPGSLTNNQKVPVPNGAGARCAACQPHIPCAPGPGGVAAEHSVTYRTEKAQRLRGGPIEPERFDIELVLITRQLLGRGVLSPG
jgi:hypothetical protein